MKYYNFILDINECNRNPPPCEDVCDNTIGSYQCSCSDTSKSVTENGSCTGNACNIHHLIHSSLIDIDECAILGICQHECTNIDGGYFCSCREGYQLVNGHNCTGKNQMFYSFIHISFT